jgi:hypothetical protein
MSRNYFDDDGFSERDFLEQESEDSYDFLEEDSQQSEEYLDDSDKVIVSEARVRLEQARLYEMLVDHDFFQGVTANPDAIKNVTQELKIFIVERLEVLLGIKEDSLRKSKAKSGSLQGDFTDMEIGFLKMLAKKGTEKHMTPKEPERTAPRPLAQPVKQAPQQLAPVKRAPDPVREQRPQPKPQPTPQKRVPVKTSQKTVAQEPSKKSIVDLAKEDLRNMKNRKSAREMTEEELLEEHKKMSDRYKKPKVQPSNALPQPDAGQLEMVYMQRSLKKTGNDVNSVLANLIVSNKQSTGGYDD